MSVMDGQDADATTFNAAFQSKSADNVSTGVQTLDNTSDANSGAEINNVQRAINLCMSVAGLVNEADATGNTYSSSTYISNGDAFKTALGKLDAAILALAGSLAFTLQALANNAAATDITGLVPIAGIKSFGVVCMVYRESISGGANIKARRVALSACWNGTIWELVEGISTPTDAGDTFTINTSTGQIQIATDNQAGTYQASTSYINWKMVDQTS